MLLRRRAKKALAILLAVSMVLGTNMPVSVLANESVATDENAVVSENSAAVAQEEVSAETVAVTEENVPAETAADGVIEFVDAGAGINLKGNSVVITEGSAADKINIYLDANRDGEIDDPEAPLAIDGETQLPANIDVYGVYNETITTPVSITVKSGSFGSVYGVCGGNITTSGETALTMRIQGGSFSYIFGAENSDISAGSKNSTALDMDVNSSVAVSGMFYGICNTMSGLSVAHTITGDVDIAIDGEVLSENLWYYSYGVDGKVTVDGDVSLKLNNGIGYNFYGLYKGVTVGGDYKVSISNAELSYVYAVDGAKVGGDVDADFISATIESPYLFYEMTVTGKADVDIISGTFGDDYDSCTNIMSRSILGEKSTIHMKDSLFYGAVNGYIYAPSYNEEIPEVADVDITVTNSTFEEVGYYDVYPQIANRPLPEQNVIMTMDAETQMEGDYTFIPANSDGYGQITCGDAVYYGGTFQFNQDVKGLKKIQISGGGDVRIPKGVTVEAESVSLSNSKLLLEGTLNGTLADTSYTYVYLNGGTLGDNTADIKYMYYPVNLSYKSKGATITLPNYNYVTVKHAFAGDQQFGQVGKSIRYAVDVKDGYTFSSVDLKDTEGNSILTPYDGTTYYSFTMPAEPCVFEVVLTPDQIVVGKTNADPVARLNEQTTKEQPLYDLSTLSISNDGKEGSVSYRVDETNGLPEGLTMTDGKIYGTPTVAYESGKKTIIHVTGKNDSVAQVTLNIVVTGGDGKQNSQDGRIAVDETSKSVYLFANSVLIEAGEGENTAIWLDDNADGVADYEEPAYEGNLSDYTVYGIRNMDTARKILITMNGGNVGTIYGAYKGDISKSGTGVEIYINGGTVGTLNGLYDAKVEDTMKIVVGNDAMVTSLVASNNTTNYDGCYTDVKGVANFYGDYTLDENISVTDLTLRGKLVIEEGVEATATNLYRNSGSVTKLRGVLRADASATSAGYILMQGGTLPENCTWSNVYYEADISQSLENDSFVVNSGAYTFEEDGVKKTYLHADSSIQVNMGDMAGYEYYYSIDQGEWAKVDGTTFSFAMPRKPITLDVEYVPSQITVTKQIADPTGIKNTAYTSEVPLYDFSYLRIGNDTTEQSGGEVMYMLKSGSKLPAGLSLSGGKIIGTPTTVNESGAKVTFVVVGRNGTTATVDLTIKILAEGDGIKDINELVTMSGSAINLNGTSVVILEDAKDSSLSQIYLDENHDKVADNSIPYRIDGKTSYNLGSKTIKGYTKPYNANDPDTVFNGDISITVKGGELSAIYGVCSDDYNIKSKVNGDVSVYVEDVDGLDTVYGAMRGDLNNLTVSVTGGNYYWADFYGASNSTIKEDLNYKIGGDAKIEIRSGDNFKSEMYVANNTTAISGDVNAEIGFTDDTCGFKENAYTNLLSNYYGVYGATVAGNVNYTLNGYWNARNTYLSHGAKVGKNMEIHYLGGSFTQSTYATYGSAKITGDISFEAPENATTYMNYFVMLANGSSAQNASFNLPKSCSSYGNVAMVSTSTPAGVANKTVFKNNGGTAVLEKGSYTITKDMSLRSLTVNENATLTIAEGVTVDMEGSGFTIASGAKLINNGTLYVETTGPGNIYGTLDNYGTFEYVGNGGSTMLYIRPDASLYNRDGASWIMAGDLDVKSDGVIVNYGSFEQTYNDSGFGYGKIYTTQPLNVYGDIKNYLNGPEIYFAVSADASSYQYCANAPTISGTAIVSSGIDGDKHQYVLGVNKTVAEPTFIVTPGSKLLDNIELSSVTYGPNDSMSATKQQNGTWAGTGSNVSEPIVLKLNYEALESVEKIELTKKADGIYNSAEDKPLVVGKTYTANKPLYDLTAIEITNDADVNAVVTYSVDSGSTLPDGLMFKDGKLYGTLTTATAQEQTITFVVKGKNQTSAFFELTLGAIAKKIPDWSAPTNLYSYVGKKLSDITLPETAYGSYSWQTPDTPLGEEVTTINDMVLIFTPNDVANYDWEAAADAATVEAAYADGVITCKVPVMVKPAIPNPTLPEGLKATYGDKLSDVAIPAGSNDGVFAWVDDPATSVGDVGTQYFRASYTPNSPNYQKIDTLWITIVVEPAVPTYTKIDSVSLMCDATLAQALLPDVKGGNYVWVTNPSTRPTDGDSYQMGFKPDDTVNYDWTRVDGWNGAWKSVVFPVTVRLEHVYGQEFSYDATKHWQVCEREACGGLSQKEAHRWDNGTVLDPATEEKEGLIEYSCECGASYEDVIPKLTHTSHVYSGAWKYDSASHWKQCTHKNCVKTTTPEDHVFDSGVAVSAPTATQKGAVKYTCKTCKYIRTVYMSQQEWVANGFGSAPDSGSNSGNTGGSTGGSNAGVDSGTAVEAPKVGTKFKDVKTKAYYKITKKEKEVAFVKPVKKTYTKVTIPKTVKYQGVTYKVTSIANDACKSNKKLKTVVIGAYVKTIGTRAFYGCTKLTSVTIGKNVTKIGNSTFQTCTVLKKITIPSKVTTIGKKAFYGCKKLATVTIGKKVTTIGDSAFQNCSTLKKITIPASVKTIGAKAFCGCAKLATVTIGKNVTSIGNSAFQNCSALKKITIPSKVSKIGSKAFYSCKKLISVTIKTTKLTDKKVGKDAFKKMGSSNYKKVSVKVPSKKLSAYKKLLKKKGLSSKAKVKK